MVDVLFADVAQPDQARIVALNAHNFEERRSLTISIKVQTMTTFLYTQACLFRLLVVCPLFVCLFCFLSLRFTRCLSATA